MSTPITRSTTSRTLPGATLGGTLVTIAAAALAGCTTLRQAEQFSLEPVPHVVTADIQAGIEQYIENQTRAGGGYFTLAFEDKELRLKLVRIHTEYLANLGPRRHFACVDLASVEGDVYDVDFFLAGDPGAMTVTETPIHKINGQPFYLWEQNADGTWARAPQTVDEASRALLGVIEDRDHFEFLYQVTLPQLTDVGGAGARRRACGFLCRKPTRFKPLR